MHTVREYKKSMLYWESNEYSFVKPPKVVVGGRENVLGSGHDVPGFDKTLLDFFCEDL